MQKRFSKNLNLGDGMRKSLFLIAAGILASSLAVADNDPPGRAARLSYVAGTVATCSSPMARKPIGLPPT